MYSKDDGNKDKPGKNCYQPNRIEKKRGQRKAFFFRAQRKGLILDQGEHCSSNREVVKPRQLTRQL
jgi:hypothetical protein